MNEVIQNVPMVQQPNNEQVGFDTMTGFETLQRIAKLFAQSSLVPQKAFAGNLGNCAIAVEMAHRLNMSPIMVMQNMYIVYGRPAWSSQFMIAAFNSCGRFELIHYVTVGKKGSDSYGMKAVSADLKTGVVLEGPVVDIQMAKEEGWYQTKGSKWQTMPDLMLRYRSATFLIRTTAPEISMGLTKDEVEDIHEEKQIDIPADEIKQHANKNTIDVNAEHVEVKDAADSKTTDTVNKRKSATTSQQKANTKKEQPAPERTGDEAPMPAEEDVPDWMFQA